MKTLFALVLSIFAIAAAPQARAQQATWIQIEALRTLAEGEARASAYATAFPNVAGFRVAGGWYAVALGPYTPTAASAELATLKSRRLIPSDSYIAVSGQYGQQFWPRDATNALQTPPAESPNTALPAAPSAPPAATYLPDETPRQARASESSLDADQRRLIQESLQWEGFYDTAIDGAFGPGTRRAMADWQAAKGYETTGVLTTIQRAELVETYRAAFADLDLGPVQDSRAGISITLPRGKVTYARTEAPFVHYDSADEDGVRVILISQTGDEATLFGLYDIMQTLEIVPPRGFRERKTRSFVLTGQSDDLHSYTYAALANGAVKGFTLVWTPKDTRVMTRVAETMRESFEPVEDVVLPDTALTGDGTDQRIDLLSGLERRRPVRSRSGFFVGEQGQVLTTTDLLGQCTRLTIGDETDAEVTAQDEALGLALLTPRPALAPIAVARFQSSLPRINSEVALAGFSYGEVLELPVLTYGALADIRGLDGEDYIDRLALGALPGDAGGPVFDTTGAVIGMLRARPEGSNRQLPEDVNFAVDVPAIADFLGAAGLSPLAAETGPAIAPEDLTTLADNVTVRVSCWN
ncbi:trypsin-like peptidase domain-containing protein [Tropicimonas sp. IMCC6043]|uniref:trypsin-like peptidase domain-containing protein n=1 Tax=Tropicimonas sp. IMCC6043 TaxID=2510645 RepID=UPI00101DAE80|nr:trypsin-like peptidase domain-containing protein [Tropicimonas sp. IMCC6043]RYH08642.1 peptidoglycan-binding protein [Tropicimonas sp. IMCC6043]